jgi:hypothetical protein
MRCLIKKKKKNLLAVLDVVVRCRDTRDSPNRPLVVPITTVTVNPQPQPGKAIDAKAATSERRKLFTVDDDSGLSDSDRTSAVCYSPRLGPKTPQSSFLIRSANLPIYPPRAPFPHAENTSCYVLDLF